MSWPYHLYHLPLPHTHISPNTRQLFAPDVRLPTHLPSPPSLCCPLDPPANRLQPRMYLEAMTSALSFTMRSCLPRWVHGGIGASGSLWWVHGGIDANGSF